MKIKLFSVYALAALLFTSCSKDDENSFTPATDTTSVRISIAQDANTRAEGGSISTTDKVTFGDGVIYFADGSIITKVMTITNAQSSNSNLNLTEITTTGTDGGALATNVPSISTQIYIVGNLPAGYTVLSEGQSINNITEATADLTDFAQVNLLPLLGNDNIVPSNNDNEPATAAISLRTIASRIEIGEIKGSGDVESFELAGIFINNYYSSQFIDGSVINGTLVNNGSEQSNYQLNGTGSYNTNNEGIIFDEYTPSIQDAAGIVTPFAAGDVWGYNIFPAKKTEDTIDNLPHIIVALDNIVVNGQTFIGKRYLTLSSFLNAGTELTEFKKGISYKIGSIEFDEEDLFITPETEPISVNVEVSVIAWETEAITWNK